MTGDAWWSGLGSAVGCLWICDLDFWHSSWQVLKMRFLFKAGSCKHGWVSSARGSWAAWPFTCCVAAPAPGWQGGCWQGGCWRGGPCREVRQLECSSCLASSSLPAWHDNLSWFMPHPWPSSRSEVCHSYLCFLTYLIQYSPEAAPLVESCVANQPLPCSCCVMQALHMILLLGDVPSVPSPIWALPSEYWDWELPTKLWLCWRLFLPLALCCFIPSCIMQHDVDNPVIITKGFKTPF